MTRLALLLVLAIQVAGPALATGHDVGGASGDSRPSPAAAADDDYAPVPISEVPERASALQAELAGALDGLEQSGPEAQLEAELPDLADLIESSAPNATRQLSTLPSLSALDLLERRWSQLEGRVAKYSELLRSREAELEALLTRLASLEVQWAKTSRAAEEGETPRVLIERISAVRANTAAAIDVVAPLRNDVAVLEGQLAELSWLTRGVLGEIADTRTAALNNIFVRDEPELWKATWKDEAVAAQFSRWRGEQTAAVAHYARRHGARLVAQAIGFLVLAFAIPRMRRGLIERNLKDDEQRLLHALDHPIAAAAVITLLLTRWIHPDAPAALINLNGLLFLAPVLLIGHALLGRALAPLLLAVAAFFLADRVREALGPEFPELARAILATEMGLGALGLLWLMRSSRLASVPPRLLRSRFFRALGLGIRVSAIVMTLAFVCVVVGYMRIGGLLGGAVLQSAYSALAVFAVLRAVEEVVHVALLIPPLTQLRIVRLHAREIERRVSFVAVLGATLVWGFYLLSALGLRSVVSDGIQSLFLAELGYGSFSVSLGSIAMLGATIWASFLLARFTQFVLEEEVYERVSLPRGVPYALSTLGRYAILIAGLGVALSAAGISLDRLAFIVGALGVGIGFGLQNVVNNFISGLILLFERPIQVGDRVELASGLNGLIRRIGIRSSTVRTWDGADVIVPNGNLIAEQVINWTLSDRFRRVNVHFGVAYGTDPSRVIELIRAAISEHPDVRSEPACEVIFEGFGDSSLDFTARAWCDQEHNWVRVRTEMGIIVNDRLAEAGIEIPFPQRDLHLRSTPES